MEGSRTAILTGAASGIGEALARDLIITGWSVACLDWQKDVGEALVAELGPQAHFVHCDVADYDQQAQAFKTVWQKYGRLDAVLANAGIFDRSSLYLLESRGTDEIPPRPDTKCTDVDFKSVLYSIQLAVHFMRKNAVPGGHLIATSSLAGRHPHPCFPEYSGAKAAVIQTLLAAEPVLKSKESISVNVVLPGIVATKLTGASTLASVNPQSITPVSQIVSAYRHFLEHPEISGQAVECSGNETIILPQPDMMHRIATETATLVKEGTFQRLHGEVSGLPDSVK